LRSRRPAHDDDPEDPKSQSAHRSAASRARWPVDGHGTDGRTANGGGCRRPAGSGGAGLPYVHTQASASASWTVNHNRGWKPASVSVLTPGGIEMNADVVHVSNTQILVNFAAPQTGSVLVN